MKKYILLLIISIQPLMAQTTLTNNGAEITILEGSKLYVNGSYVEAKTAKNEASNIYSDGSILLTGNLINQTEQHVIAEYAVDIDKDVISFGGKVVFHGQPQQEIITEGSHVNFCQLVVDKPESQLLLTNDSITLQSALTLEQGNIYLKGHNIYLLNDQTNRKGHIAKEGGENYIYDNQAGAVKTRMLLENVDLGNAIAGMGLQLQTDNTNLGHTEFIRRHQFQPGVGDKSIQKYFMLKNGKYTSPVIQAAKFHYINKRDLQYGQDKFIEPATLSFWNEDPYMSGQWRKRDGKAKPAENLVLMADDIEIFANQWSKYTLAATGTEICDSIKAKFLIQSLTDLGDSIKFVQLTNPEPTVVYWDFGDGFFSMDPEPVHHYEEAGDYKIMMAIEKGGACIDTLYKTISIKAGSQTENQPDSLLQEYQEIPAAVAYPNPTSGEFKVQLELSDSTHVHMVLYNVQGMLIDERYRYTKKVDESYNLQNYAAGMYLLRMRVLNQYQVLKLIKR